MFEELKEAYDDYSAWVAGSKAGQTVGQRVMGVITRNHAFSADPKHQSFFSCVETYTGGLQERLAAGTEDRACVPALLQYAFVDCYIHSDKVSSLMFLAAERLFLPLFPYLTREDAGRLYSAYRLQRKKDPGLPVQAVIQKELKRRSTMKIAPQDGRG